MRLSVDLRFGKHYEFVCFRKCVLCFVSIIFNFCYSIIIGIFFLKNPGIALGGVGRVVIDRIR